MSRPKIERNEAILMLARSGKSYVDIAATFGLHDTVVSRIARRNGLRRGRPGKRRDPIFVMKVRALWQRGMTFSEIGHELGVSKGVIAGISDRHNFSARPRAWV